MPLDTHSSSFQLMALVDNAECLAQRVVGAPPSSEGGSHFDAFKMAVILVAASGPIISRTTKVLVKEENIDTNSQICRQSSNEASERVCSTVNYFGPSITTSIIGKLVLIWTGMEASQKVVERQKSTPMYSNPDDRSTLSRRRSLKSHIEMSTSSNDARVKAPMLPMIHLIKWCLVTHLTTRHVECTTVPIAIIERWLC